MSEANQQGERQDTTLNISKRVSTLLAKIAERDDRKKKEEVAFLVKERAKALGIKGGA